MVSSGLEDDIIDSDQAGHPLMSLCCPEEGLGPGATLKAHSKD